MECISKKRNGELDFWKFVFSVVIVIHHSYKLFDDEYLYFAFGSLAVEFFFIVSGYLFASSVLQKKEPYDVKTIGSETSSFIFKKTYGFIYYFLFAAVLKILVNIFVYGAKNVFFNHKFSTIIFDCLFLNATGLDTYNVISATWYISAMLLAMAVMYPIFRKKPDLFINVIAPVTAIFLYGIMYKHDGYFGDRTIWYAFTTKGVVRAFAGLSLGCFCCKMVLSIKTNPIFTQAGKHISHILSLVDILCLAGSVYGMYTTTKINSDNQAVIIFALAIGTTVCASRMASISKLFSGKIFTYLGRLSMSVFFCHAVILEIMKYCIVKSETLSAFRETSEGALITVVVFVIGSVILGIICLAVCDPVKKAADRKIVRLKERTKELSEV